MSIAPFPRGSLLACAATLVAATAVSAQDSPVFALLPEARNMPAPDWLRPGIRLTYYAAVGVSTGGQFVRDANGNYRIEGREGKYKIYEGGTAGSGHGYIELNVAALEDKAVAVQVRNFPLLDANPLSVPKYAGASGFVVPGGGTDYWVHPAALEELARQAGQTAGFLVGPVEYELDGRKVPAIRVGDKDTGYTYDLRSGVLLFMMIRSKVAGKNPVRTEDGRIYDGSGSSAFMLQFRGFRQVDLPWRGGAMPKWLATTKTLRYDGGSTLAMAGVPPATVPLSARMELIGGGRTWVKYKQTTTAGSPPEVGGVPMMPTTTEVVAGPAQIGGVWLPPEEIEKLRPGTTIDRDAWTHLVTTVEYVGEVDGRRVCVLAETSPSYRLEYHYDLRSGGLVRGSMREDLGMGMVTEVVATLSAAR